jgi:hypothetical protein
MSGRVNVVDAAEQNFAYQLRKPLRGTMCG